MSKGSEGNKVICWDNCSDKEEIIVVKLCKETNECDENTQPRATKPFVCKICSRSFREKQTLKQHIHTHTGERPFTCDQCPSSFTQVGSLRRHQELHNNDVKHFACTHCDLTFRQYNNLKRHLNLHSPCSVSFQCDICSRRFARKAGLLRHAKTHLSKHEKLLCEYCDKTFADDESLQRHVKWHADKINATLNNDGEKLKRLKCGHYQTSYSRPGSLQKSKCSSCANTRTVSLLFACTFCDFTASTASLLEEHQQEHYKNQSFLCSAAFSCQPSLLELIEKFHESGKPWLPCEICHDTFTSQTKLNKHYLVHRKEVSDLSDYVRLYQCHSCGVLFTDRGGIIRHVRKHEKESHKQMKKNDQDKGTQKPECSSKIERKMRIQENNPHVQSTEPIAPQNHTTKMAEFKSNNNTLHRKPNVVLKDLFQQKMVVCTPDKSSAGRESDVNTILKVLSEGDQSTHSEMFSDIFPGSHSKIDKIDEGSIVYDENHPLKDLSEDDQSTQSEPFSYIPESCSKTDKMDDVSIIYDGYQPVAVLYNNAIVKGEINDAYIERLVAGEEHLSRNIKEEIDENDEISSEIFASEINSHLELKESDETYSTHLMHMYVDNKDHIKQEYDKIDEKQFTEELLIENMKYKYNEVVIDDFFIEKNKKENSPFENVSFVSENLQAEISAKDQDINNQEVHELNVVVEEQYDEISLTDQSTLIADEIELGEDRRSFLLEERTTSAPNSPRDFNEETFDDELFTYPEDSGKVINEVSRQETQHSNENISPLESFIEKLYEPVACSISNTNSPIIKVGNEFEEIFKLPKKVEKSVKETKLKDCIIRDEEHFDADDYIIFEEEALEDRNSKSPFFCYVCKKSYSTKSSLKRHFRFSHTNVEKFQCAQCSKMFQSKDALSKHIRALHNPHRYICDVCLKTFNRKDALKSHQRLHAGDKPFACPECGECFAQKQNLHAHSKKHLKERPYTCSECGKGFYAQTTLKRHRMIHTGERNYRCNICDKSFIQKCHLDNHYVVHGLTENTKNFLCPLCDKMFFRKETMLRHKAIHFEVDESALFYCLHCKKGIKSKAALRVHLKNNVCKNNRRLRMMQSRVTIGEKEASHKMETRRKR